MISFACNFESKGYIMTVTKSNQNKTKRQDKTKRKEVGMKTPHSNKTESIQLRLTPEMHSFVLQSAIDRDVSAPEFVRGLIKNFKQKVTKCNHR